MFGVSDTGCGRRSRMVLLPVILLAVLGPVGLACGSPGDEGPGLYRKVDIDGGSYMDVMPEELDRMLSEDGDRILLVNVHIPYAAELPGTDLFLPYNDIERRVGELPEDKTSRIAVYCVSGPMSAEATRTLVGLGYEDVWDLHGGMSQWRQDGFPLEQRDR